MRVRCCCCYHKGTYFQANHNSCSLVKVFLNVVVATTKVHIFKQITTLAERRKIKEPLLLLPQRYIFSSKSQLQVISSIDNISCCCYHKGTYFQANHNRIFNSMILTLLLLLPQRYIFSSKSQHFQRVKAVRYVVVATTKVHIFKQITTV